MKVVFDYFKYFKNPISALFLKFGLINTCEVKLRTKNDSFVINNVLILDRLIDKLPFVPDSIYVEFKNYINDLIEDKEIIKINNINFFNVYNSNFLEKNKNIFGICYDEYFSDDDWNMVNLDGRNVIDIGGNVADTALIFAADGANVIAFEPVKHLYDLALRNISINPNYASQIQFINKSIGGKRGKLDINLISSEDYVNKEENYYIDVLTVSDILSIYNFTPDILKMDCEGCEFEIIEHEDLSMFNDIILEHHSFMVKKDAADIIERLENQGFNIEIYEFKASRRSFKEIGFIHAFK